MFKKLSETEMFIMEELWRVGRPISVKELADRFHSQKIQWKIQTISTFLVRMEKKKFIESVKKGKGKLYFPIVSSEEIHTIEAKGLLENYYEGSFKKFLVALSNGKISEEKADELEKWLNEQEGDSC